MKWLLKVILRTIIIIPVIIMGCLLALFIYVMRQLFEGLEDDPEDDYYGRIP